MEIMLAEGTHFFSCWRRNARIAYIPLLGDRPIEAGGPSRHFVNPEIRQFFLQYGQGFSYPIAGQGAAYWKKRPSQIVHLLVDFCVIHLSALHFASLGIRTRVGGRGCVGDIV